MTPNKRGRPVATDPHRFRVPARFTESERRELESRARLAGVSLAEFLRRAALGRDALALSSADLVSRRA
jgi:hypothetical protein